MNGLQTVIDMEEIHTNFRLWLTTEVNKDFPIGLLQMSLKFTNEPPQGIRASLKRTYADVTQDTLDYSNHPSWPSLLYSVAFLHTVVQVSLIFLFVSMDNEQNQTHLMTIFLYRITGETKVWSLGMERAI